MVHDTRKLSLDGLTGHGYDLSYLSVAKPDVLRHLWFDFTGCRFAMDA
ncbi:uncharacterized protein METZ01_LOCUS81394 [marine metagenome]|uniref:Uncharacterized protein n=1 Tax=marine metagenome TaxID=408172 RepID=A0A381UKA2_9ZZZZ